MGVVLSSNNINIYVFGEGLKKAIQPEIPYSQWQSNRGLRRSVSCRIKVQCTILFRVEAQY